MCLIAQRSNPAFHIPQDVIEYNRRANPDGFGLAWRNKKEIRYKKFAPEAWQAFEKLLRDIDATGVQYVAHWRKATHGKPCEELSHPFHYKDAEGNAILAFHNGIIDIDTDANESDTSAFVYRVLSELPYGWWLKPAWNFLVESSIGWSKLLLMTAKEDIIINASKWMKQSGLNYSTYPTGMTYTVTPKLADVARGVVDTGGAWSDKTAKDAQAAFYAAQAKYPHLFEDELEEELLPIEDDASVRYPGHDRLRWTRANGWTHYEHKLAFLNEVPYDVTGKKEDKQGDVVCDTCRTEGDFYVIDGAVYVDIAHNLQVDDENETGGEG